MAAPSPGQISQFQKIHSLAMNLNISTIEIKTWQCLESWSGGILVIVSGLMQMRDWPTRRRIVQTFFLAPEEKGYFVLNDMSRVLDQEHGPQFVGSMCYHCFALSCVLLFERERCLLFVLCIAMFNLKTFELKPCCYEYFSYV